MHPNFQKPRVRIPLLKRTGDPCLESFDRRLLNDLTEWFGACSSRSNFNNAVTLSNTSKGPASAVKYCGVCHFDRLGAQRRKRPQQSKNFRDQMSYPQRSETPHHSNSNNQSNKNTLSPRQKADRKRKDWVYVKAKDKTTLSSLENVIVNGLTGALFCRV